jgi:hypothetical protein
MMSIAPLSVGISAARRIPVGALSRGWLKDWMAARGIYPSDAAVPLSSGAYCEFGDFANLMKVIEHVWLGGGEKARKLLDVHGEPSGGDALVEIDGAALSFADLKLEKCE